MKWRKWLENWDMTALKISAPFLEMEWNPRDADKNAAWELYVELLTRITMQPLDRENGDEKAALESVYSLFAITRQVLKNNTRDCQEFTKIAVIVLNQVIRPFTAKWHRLCIQGALSDTGQCIDFRNDLYGVQKTLRTYMKMLADMAGVEDLTSLELSEDH